MRIVGESITVAADNTDQGTALPPRYDRGRQVQLMLQAATTGLVHFALLPAAVEIIAANNPATPFDVGVPIIIDAPVGDDIQLKYRMTSGTASLTITPVEL